MKRKEDRISGEIRRAVKGIGKPELYFVRSLLEGGVFFARCEQQVLDEELGVERSRELVGRIWGLWALEQGRKYCQEFQKQGIPLDARLLGKIFRKWFEDNWLVTYEIVEDTADRHEGKITHCLDETLVKELFGKGTGIFDNVYATSQLEAKAICKSAGLDEKFDGTFTGFICTGCSCDKVVFERKK